MLHEVTRCYMRLQRASERVFCASDGLLAQSLSELLLQLLTFPLFITSSDVPSCGGRDSGQCIINQGPLPELQMLQRALSYHTPLSRRLQGLSVLMLVASRANQYYEAKYYQDGQEYYSGKTLHRENPPLSIDNYGYDEQYKCQRNRQELHHSWGLKYKVSNEDTDNQQLKDIKKCFCNIFLLSFTKVHNSNFIIASELCQEKGSRLTSFARTILPQYSSSEARRAESRSNGADA